MQTIEKNQQLDSARAGRAMGAMFFAIFGGVWIAYWSTQTFAGSIMALLLIAALTATVFMLALNQFRRFKSALRAEKDSPFRRRAVRWFHIINAGQWIVIVIGANVLANAGLGKWIIPFAMLVIGLHFLPLAHMFSNPPHYVTGGAMIILALTFPQLFSGGPTDPGGCLGAGLILWASAMWATRDALTVQVK